MQNNLLKHGFLRKKAKDGLIFEKKELKYSFAWDGEIEELHRIVKKGNSYFLSEVKEKNKIKDYNQFLNIFNYKNKSEYGFVYLIEYNNAYKIGMTKDIVTRLKFFKNTLPGKVNLHNYIVTSNYKIIEKMFHKFFKGKIHSKYDREWFILNERDLFFFQKIKSIVED